MKIPHIHGFNPHPEFTDYEVCESCGSLHRFRNVDPPSFYSNAYWDREGFSNLEDQVHNVSVHRSEDGKSKIDSVLEFSDRGSSALEIACAPGVLLKSLRQRYDHVVGIEYDPAYRARIAAIVAGQAAIVYGPFPAVTAKWPSESFDFICGMDIFEHVEDGEAFMAECLRLLKSDGTLALMCPMVLDGKKINGNNLRGEHIWIYSLEFLRGWFGSLFKTVKTSQWVPDHEIIVGIKKKEAGKK